MCSKHYHEKYNGQRPTNKRPFPLAPTPEERARRVKLSYEWTNKAQISEEIKLMADHEESDSETEKFINAMKKEIKELVVKSVMSSDEEEARHEKEMERFKAEEEGRREARREEQGEKEEEGDKEREFLAVRWNLIGEEEKWEKKELLRAEWGANLWELIEEEWDEEEWEEMKKKLRKCGLKLSLI